MKRLPIPFFSAALAASVLLGAGCASEPDRYYTLAAPAGSPAPVPEATPPVFVELAPIALPDRLARPQMVVRGNSAGAQVRVLEKHRWSASLEKEMRDALASGIVARSGAIDVSKVPRQAGEPVWRIAVQLTEFDAVEDSGVEAAFGWTLRRSDNARSLHCSWRASEPATGGIGALAQGAQRVTSRAAEAIARQLAALRSNPSAACLPSA